MQPPVQLVLQQTPWLQDPLLHCAFPLHVCPLLKPPVVQAPATQLCPAWQTVPQAPQLFLSDWVSKHPLAHEVVPVGHAQTPLLQFAPVLHAVLQVPQWLGSVWRVTHCVPHKTCPAEHVGFTQAPLVQVCPAWQA